MGRSLLSPSVRRRHEILSAAPRVGGEVDRARGEGLFHLHSALVVPRVVDVVRLQDRGVPRRRFEIVLGRSEVERRARDHVLHVLPQHAAVLEDVGLGGLYRAGERPVARRVAEVPVRAAELALHLRGRQLGPRVLHPGAVGARLRFQRRLEEGRVGAEDDVRGRVGDLYLCGAV